MQNLLEQTENFQKQKVRMSAAQKRKAKKSKNTQSTNLKNELFTPQVIQLTRDSVNISESKKSFATIAKEIPSKKEFTVVETVTVKVNTNVKPIKAPNDFNSTEIHKLQYSWNLYGTLFNSESELSIVGFYQYNPHPINDISNFWRYANNSFLDKRINQSTSSELSFTRVTPDAAELVNDYSDAYEINIIGPSYFESVTTNGITKICTREKIILELIGACVCQDEKENDEIIKSFLGFKFRRGSDSNFRLWFSNEECANKYMKIIKAKKLNPPNNRRPNNQRKTIQQPIEETIDTYLYVSSKGRKLAQVVSSD